MNADDPNSGRPPTDIHGELQHMRRLDDRRREHQIEALTTTVNELRDAMSALQHSVDLQAALSDQMVERATKQAVAGVFAQFGVDVNNPAQLQALRDDLRFSAYTRESAKKGFYGLMTAVGSAVVGAVLYFLTQWGGQK
ncbi:MAG: hypothetical protein ABTR07_09005 [Candidatus Competibacter denitrificans]